MPAGVAAASPMVAGERTPTVALDSAAAAGRFHGKQTSKTKTSSNPIFYLHACQSWLSAQFDKPDDYGAKTHVTG